MNSKIYEICGESDLLPELENIKNDPIKGSKIKEDKIGKFIN